MEPEFPDTLGRLDLTASQAPWYVDQLDDEDCMRLVAVTNRDPATMTLAGKDWDAEQVIAACLVQSPSYVSPADTRWNENAALIAEMRNSLPELIRLARIGLALEHDRARRASEATRSP